MEMNAANVTQHKICHRKPSFIDRKIDEKSRFSELSTEEIQEKVDNLVPVTPKKATKCRMRLFYVMVHIT